MTKTILVTGATAGIGRLTATKLAAAGHHVLLHGRSADKLDALRADLGTEAQVSSYVADLSRLGETAALADHLLAEQGVLSLRSQVRPKLS